ncbi:MAG: magnesium transporter [Thermoanaerobaculia bacterium]
MGPRRAELIGDTLRRFVRRGARANLSKLLGKTRPEDVALQFRGLTPAEQITVFQILVADYPEGSGAVLTELESPQQQALLEELSPQQLATVLDSMSVDDAVSLVESLPPELHDKVLEVVDLKDLAEVQTHLTYGDDTAGRLMVPEYVALSEDKTVGDAIAFIQQTTELDNVFYLYVVDRDGHLVGVTSLRQLLLSPPARTLDQVMTRSIIKVNTDTDQEEVAQLAARYNLLAVPVTDEANHLVGIVTLDDIIDVVKEEATEDIFKMVGTTDDELVYQDRSFRVAGFRLPWLLVNLVGLLLAGMLIKHFQVTLKETLFLLTFVPVIMGMAGNIGSQTATIAVRGLATGRVNLGEGGVRTFLWQQLKVGAILAVACSVLVAIGAWLLERHLAYAGVVGTSMFLALVLASVNGAIVPVIFDRLGIDPAVAAGPLVTTSNDITGIFIYFGLASFFIDLLVR